MQTQTHKEKLDQKIEGNAGEEPLKMLSAMASENNDAHKN